MAAAGPKIVNLKDFIIGTHMKFQKAKKATAPATGYIVYSTVDSYEIVLPWAKSRFGLSSFDDETKEGGGGAGTGGAASGGFKRRGFALDVKGNAELTEELIKQKEAEVREYVIANWADIFSEVPTLAAKSPEEVRKIVEKAWKSVLRFSTDEEKAAKYGGRVSLKLNEPTQKWPSRVSRVRTEVRPSDGRRVVAKRIKVDDEGNAILNPTTGEPEVELDKDKNQAFEIIGPHSWVRSSVTIRLTYGTGKDMLFLFDVRDAEVEPEEGRMTEGAGFDALDADVPMEEPPAAIEDPVVTE